MHKTFAICLLLVSLLFIAGCSDSSDDSSTTSTTIAPTEVTNDQAAILSNVLFKNHEHGGGTFSIRSGTAETGFTAKGEVGWGAPELSFVNLNVVINNADPDLEALILIDGVFEKFTNVKSGSSQDVLGDKYVFRPYDPTKYGIDALGQFVSKLAAETPDNPVLIKSNGAKYLGTEKIGDVQTSKFQISDNVTYFVTKDGDLKKVIATLNGFESPVEITFISFQNSNFIAPLPDETINFDDIADDYLLVRPSF